MIEGVKPGAVKAASPVLNGEVEETDHRALRLDLTQLHRPTGKEAPDIPCLRCQLVNLKR